MQPGTSSIPYSIGAPSLSTTDPETPKQSRVPISRVHRQTPPAAVQRSAARILAAPFLLACLLASRLTTLARHSKLRRLLLARLLLQTAKLHPFSYCPACPDQSRPVISSRLFRPLRGSCPLFFSSPSVKLCPLASLQHRAPLPHPQPPPRSSSTYQRVARRLTLSCLQSKPPRSFNRNFSHPLLCWTGCQQREAVHDYGSLLLTSTTNPEFLGWEGLQLQPRPLQLKHLTTAPYFPPIFCSPCAIPRLSSID